MMERSGVGGTERRRWEEEGGGWVGLFVALSSEALTGFVDG